MVWPLSVPAIAVVVVVTLAASTLSVVRARKVRILTRGAVLSGNRAAMAATERRARRVLRQHLTYSLPTVGIGMVLLATQAVAYMVLALPR